MKIIKKHTTSDRSVQHNLPMPISAPLIVYHLMKRTSFIIPKSLKGLLFVLTEINTLELL